MNVDVYEPKKIDIKAIRRRITRWMRKHEITKIGIVSQHHPMKERWFPSLDFSSKFCQIFLLKLLKAEKSQWNPLDRFWGASVSSKVCIMLYEASCREAGRWNQQYICVWWLYHINYLEMPNSIRNILKTEAIMLL